MREIMKQYFDSKVGPGGCISQLEDKTEEIVEKHGNFAENCAEARPGEEGVLETREVMDVQEEEHNGKRDMEGLEMEQDRNSIADRDSSLKISEDKGQIEQLNGDNDDVDSATEQVGMDKSEMEILSEDEDLDGKWYYSKPLTVVAGKESKLNLASYMLTRKILNLALAVIVSEMDETASIEHAAVYTNEIECTSNRAVGVVHFVSNVVKVGSAMIGNYQQIDKEFKASALQVV